MRTCFLAALAIATVLPAPGATAQATDFPTTTSVYVEPFAEPLTPDGLYTLRGRVDYSYVTLGAATALAPTKVRVAVSAAPAWAFVSVSPSTLLFPVRVRDPVSLTTSESLGFSVIVSINDDAPPGATNGIEIVARAERNGLLSASEGGDTVAVRTARFEPCHHDAAAAAGAAAAPDDEPDAAEITTATAGSTPVGVAPTLVLGAIGVAGAGAGAIAVLRRRRG